MNEKELIKKLFPENNLLILNGPFKGMKYINKSVGSALLPKLIGSYEEPIQEWIEYAINTKKYSKILNLGCAEGYYAVGFAKRMPNTKIIAYDINQEARELCLKLSKINNITNIEIKGLCDFKEMYHQIEENTLIFCDIEGNEKKLLDPTRVSKLRKTDIIVESHDFIHPGLTNLLIRRFIQTHKIKIIIDYVKRIKKYFIPIKINESLFHILTNEERPNFMFYLYMESI